MMVKYFDYVIDLFVAGHCIPPTNRLRVVVGDHNLAVVGDGEQFVDVETITAVKPFMTFV
jgi:hypothetical protein